MRWQLFTAACCVAACVHEPPRPPLEVGQSNPIVIRDVDGKEWRPLELADARACVLFFITNDCPISNAYSPEINRICAEFAKRGVAFYMVHVDRKLSPDQARQHAKEFGYKSPVLLDREHRLVEVTGVKVTPEVAVYAKDSGLVYRGRIDDSYYELGRQRAAPTSRDLRDVLSAVLSGGPIRFRATEAIGCPIPRE